jgi:hypothetical protein
MRSRERADEMQGQVQLLVGNGLGARRPAPRVAISRNPSPHRVVGPEREKKPGDIRRGHGDDAQGRPSALARDRFGGAAVAVTRARAVPAQVEASCQEFA